MCIYTHIHNILYVFVVTWSETQTFTTPQLTVDFPDPIVLHPYLWDLSTENLYLPYLLFIYIYISICPIIPLCLFFIYRGYNDLPLHFYKGSVFIP